MLNMLSVPFEWILDPRGWGMLSISRKVQLEHVSFCMWWPVFTALASLVAILIGLTQWYDPDSPLQLIVRHVCG